MLNGSAFQVLFEIVWTTFTMTYPVGAIWITLSPALERLLLTQYFWLVYISAVLYIAMILLNFDIVLGRAADQLRIENSSVVKSLVGVNTVFSSFAIITHTIYSIIAADDYNALIENETRDTLEPRLTE